MCLIVLGCGGHTVRSDAEEIRNASAGASNGDAGATTAPRGCPDASWGQCRSRSDLTVRIDGRTEGADGVWAEPAQIPLDPRPVAPPPDGYHASPDSWDRSPLPHGACVFRVHNAPASCFGERGRLTFGACDPGGPPRPIPVSYYEQPDCEQGIAPGCPGPSAPWGNQNYEWYAAREADGTVLVVLCAGLCETLRQSTAACLSQEPRITTK